MLGGTEAKNLVLGPTAAAANGNDNDNGEDTSEANCKNVVPLPIFFTKMREERRKMEEQWSHQTKQYHVMRFDEGRATKSYRWETPETACKTKKLSIQRRRKRQRRKKQEEPGSLGGKDWHELS